MTSLADFLKPIEIASVAINGINAYKMDSTADGSDMRKMVGLGTCHSCDYFFPTDDVILLIEETQLMKEIEEIRKRYECLEKKDMDDFVNKIIPDKIKLKVYGAMLILERLKARCSSANSLIKNDKYEFWLVVSKIETGGEKRYFDNMKDSLRVELKGLLGSRLLHEVDVVSSDYFVENFPKRCWATQP